MGYSNFKSRLRWFIRVDANGNPVAGSLIQRKRIPREGSTWRDVTDCINDPCCTTSTTTTTTTTE